MKGEYFIQCSDCKYYNLSSKWCDQYKAKKKDEVIKRCFFAKRFRGQPKDHNGRDVGAVVVEEVKPLEAEKLVVEQEVKIVKPKKKGWPKGKPRKKRQSVKDS